MRQNEPVVVLTHAVLEGRSAACAIDLASRPVLRTTAKAAKQAPPV
jgi:hypothetical protein